MLGRTLLYTAVTRARKLVVVVGQPRALAMAVRDWRRVERHTSLDGLLAGSLAYGWRTPAGGSADEPGGVPEAWDGLLEAPPEE